LDFDLRMGRLEIRRQLPHPLVQRPSPDMPNPQRDLVRHLHTAARGAGGKEEQDG